MIEDQFNALLYEYENNIITYKVYDDNLRQLEKEIGRHKHNSEECFYNYLKHSKYTGLLYIFSPVFESVKTPQLFCNFIVEQKNVTFSQLNRFLGIYKNLLQKNTTNVMLVSIFSSHFLDWIFTHLSIDQIKKVFTETTKIDSEFIDHFIKYMFKCIHNNKPHIKHIKLIGIILLSNKHTKNTWLF